MAKEIKTKRTQKKWLKVLQFFAAYLVAAWTFLQFVDWIINRYQLSPYWVEMWLWLFVGIIPSLVIYLYHQERINKRVLHLREKIIFPLNVFIIAIGLYLGFGTSDLGATTKEITYTREDGTLLRKRITKDEFRIGVPIFNFKQTSKDSTSMWLENGIRDLLYLDMHQDKNVKPLPVHADNTTDKVQGAKVFFEFYVDGTYAVNKGIYSVKPELRKSSNGQSIASRTFSGKELNKLLDSISIYIRKEAGVNDKQRAQYVDMNIQEFTSDSFKAIEQFVLGDYDKAIAIDSTFALAYLQKAQTNIFFSEGKYEERYNIDKAFLNRSKLPADRQLQVLIYKHIAYEDYEKAEKLVNLQLEIEPNNEVYTDLLYLIYSETKQVKAYLDYAKSKFEKEESNYNVGRYGQALLINGDYQPYIDYVDNYMKNNPENKSWFLLNIVPLILKGDLIEAHKILDKATVLRPDWENINRVYNSTLNYLESNPAYKTDLSFFVGEFRTLRNEIEERIWIKNNVLLNSASNQRIWAAIRSGDAKLTLVFTLGSLSTANYLQNKEGKTYAIQFEQYNMETSWKYFAFKLDNTIRRAESFLEKNDLVNAEHAYLEAIANNPNHFYLKDALAHINYMKETDSTDLQKQYKDVIGTYGQLKIWLENNKLMFKRGNDARIVLLPMSKSRYMNMSNLSSNFEFDYQNEKVIGSFTWGFDVEKMQWIKQDAENQYISKD